MEGIKAVSSEMSYDLLYVMRSSLIKEDDTDQWKQRRAAPIVPTGAKTDASNLMVDNSFCEDNHTRIFASLVPDEIIYNIGDYSKRNFDVCLLFGDVSGFTELCEKYNKTGKGGPSRLTQILNNYIGAMVQEILSHGGDVLKFSGDAFIAMWKVTDNLSMRDAVHEALDCSLIIQKVYGRYQADVDVVVRVKLAVSAGHLTFSLIGDEINSHYFGFGPPITDLKAAEALSLAGDIIVTRAAWQHVSPNEYLAEEFKGGMNIKVFGVGPNWRNIQRSRYNKEDTYSIITADRKVSMATTVSNLSVTGGESSGTESDDSHIAQIYTSSDQYALRPAVNLAVRLRLKDALRRFILAPVERGITSDEPIEYLTEIRQVTVLFINCKVSYSMEANKCIDIAHRVYLGITKIVTAKHGCVNKVNMFDKDLMLLVIFGLRGLKHEMESQVALKCATECHQTVGKYENIQGVSIGVTTGKTYCGAFGHTLRREYTVISLTVNKAARIMVAYPYRVTCDRETFLHSKLEPRNFVLQEYKPLKGIANPGPIYEFKEIDRDRDVSVGVCARPLLGREQEINLYLHLFNHAKKNAKEKHFVQISHSMMVVHAEARQGKTRLLEEMVYVSDSQIPFIRLNLNKADMEESYTAIRLIFYPLLRISENSTVEDIELKLVRRLDKYSVSEHYHLLNDIFMVDFPCPIFELKDDPDHQNLKLIFEALCTSCFIRYWTIAIDDSEYIDDQSWMLIEILIKHNCAFIIATMGLRSYISHTAMEVLKNPKVKIVQMKSIDKWFHVGLACQMLDVEAIPPELEKVIQLQSNGNPGWIESFLISLVQSGGLYIREVARKTAYDTGLIIAPLYMMLRLTSEEIDLWVQIVEEGSSGDDCTRWKMYVDSCRESYPDLTVATTLKEKFDLYASINVCVLNPNFNIADVDPELSMDVIILKTFDSLTSYQQLLLKCSAILGITFPRAMLMYIMSSAAIRLTALAVKKLFEIHVLTCAKGDFVDGGLVFKERLKNPNEDYTVMCACRGLLINEACEDLPKYASCGYLRFRSSTFQETTYNLLTDNQKKEFHSRAIRYLEKETRKCRTCGNGYFSRFIGSTLDQDLRAPKKQPKKKFSLVSSSTESPSTTSVEHMEANRSSVLSALGRYSDSFKYTKDATQHGSFRGTGASFGFGSLSQTPEEPFSDSSGAARLEWLGLSVIKKYKNDYAVTRTFSDIDFSDCTCLLILSTMYHQLVEHCCGAGLLEKQMNAMIEYAYVCIDIQNVPQALKILEETLQVLEGPTAPFLEYDWMLNLKRGKVHTIIATGQLKLAAYHEAYQNLKLALQFYGRRFPESNVAKSIFKNMYKLRQIIALFIAPNLYHGLKIDDTVAEYYNDLAECMSRLCEYFMVKDLWKEAKIAASISLRYAVVSASDFIVVLNAFAHMIDLSTYFGENTFNVAFEVYALKVCCRKKVVTEPRELKAVARLYSAIFFGRVVRSEIEKSLHIGYVLWRISYSTHMVFIMLTTLPMLIQLVLFKLHIIEAGNMLREIIVFANEDIDNSAKSWYYGLCISFHLYTGLVVEPFQKSLAFIQGEGQEPTLRDPAAKRRLVTATWLWNVRNENWEGAFICQEQAWSYHIQERGESVENIFTALHLLEGLIIYMVGKMDKKNINAAYEARSRTKKMFRELFALSKTVNLILPRLYHLKAYFEVAKNNDYEKALDLLKSASRVAKKYGNDLEDAWIDHSEQAWSNKIPKNEKRFWQNHSEEETIHYVEFDEVSDRLGYYSLPTPMYL